MIGQLFIDTAGYIVLFFVGIIGIALQLSIFSALVLFSVWIIEAIREKEIWDFLKFTMFFLLSLALFLVEIGLLLNHLGI